MTLWIKLDDERRVNVDCLMHYAPLHQGADKHGDIVAVLLTFHDGHTISTAEPIASIDRKIGEAYVIEQSMLEFAANNPLAFVRTKKHP